MSQPSSARLAAARPAPQRRRKTGTSDTPSIWWRFVAASLIAMVFTSFVWALGAEVEGDGPQVRAAETSAVQVARVERHGYW